MGGVRDLRRLERGASGGVEALYRFDRSLGSCFGVERRNGQAFLINIFLQSLE